MARKPEKTQRKKKAPGKARAAKRPAAYDAEGRPTNTHLDSVLSEIIAEPEKTRIEADAFVECPYCGEGFELHVTSADEGQTKVEDCLVCSRSISIFVHTEEDELHVSAYRS